MESTTQNQVFKRLFDVVSELIQEGANKDVLSQILGTLSVCYPEYNEAINDAYECLMGYSYPEIKEPE